ncbi:unnamed protein product [Brassica rapa]|uniref:Uncharacterized protein n=1 Tax=Brassica campestris TaxID=3711 RepID=A0A8D9G0Y8_BRACM|nr:unnamed protein product [Brassica rapa]
MLALPVDCLGDFGPQGLSVQYSQDVRGCPPAHTGRPWLSVAVGQHTQDVRGCPCMSVCVPQTGRLWLSVSTHRKFVAVHQYTYQHVGPWTQHDDPPRGLFGTHRTSGGVRQHTHDICTCLWLSVSTHRTSVAVRVCLSAHTGRPCVSVSTHRTSVYVRQHTQDVRVCPSAHTGRPCVSVCVRQLTQDVCGCPLVHISALCTHRTSVCVRQHTHWTFVAVRVCPCVSVSTDMTSMALGLSMLTLPGVCSGDFGPRGLSVQYTQDVRGCPPAHTGRQWLSDVRGCPCVRACPSVSVSTQRTSVAVPQYTYQHVGPWTQHAGPSCGLFGGCLFSTHRTSVGVRQHTQDIRGCLWLSVSTHRTSVDVRVCLCVSVCVRVAHTGRPWLSVSTHISTLVLGLNTLALPVDCLGDFGPRGLSVQYTHDVCGCPSAHTGRLCMSRAVRVCPSAHTGRPWLSINTHISMLVLGLSTLTLPVDCSVHTGRLWVSASINRTTSVGVRQHTQDVRGCPCVSVYVCLCPSAHTGSPWLTSVCVRVCLSAHTGRSWMSVSTHRTSVCVRKHTQDVCGCTCDICGCPSAHTGRPLHTGRPWVSASTHRMSVAVRVCLSAHT